MEVPPHWTRVPEVRSKTELLEKRKQEMKPDISFDLDGDQVVGGFDYVIAKRFDRDGDGKLNQQERKEALDAIQAGYANKFVWGCESSGVNRSFRVIQKRGKEVLAQDFTPVKASYSMGNRIEKSRTKKNIEEELKKSWQENCKKLEDKLDYGFLREATVEQMVNTRDWSNIPEFSTLSQKKKLTQKQARQKAGLGKKTILSRNQPLSLPFVQHPKYSTLSQMKSDKKHKMIQDLNKAMNYSHLDDYKRLQMREDHKLDTPDNGLTYRKLKQTMKKKDMENHMKKFGKMAIGVHKAEIPRFSSFKKEYWQIPQFSGQQSRKKLFQLRKGQDLHRKPQVLAINDYESLPPAFHFQAYTNHKRIIKQQKQITPKPTQISLINRSLEVPKSTQGTFANSLIKFIEAQKELRLQTSTPQPHKYPTVTQTSRPIRKSPRIPFSKRKTDFHTTLYSAEPIRTSGFQLVQLI